MNPNRYKGRKITRNKMKRTLFYMSCGVCPICGNKIQIKDCNDLDTYMTIDHIIPKSKGGRGNFRNSRPMCKSCNQKRGTLDTRRFIDYKAAILS